MRRLPLALLLVAAGCGADAPAPEPPAPVAQPATERAPIPDADLPRFVLGGAATARRAPIDVGAPEVRAALREQGPRYLRLTSALTDTLARAAHWRAAQAAADRLAPSVPPLYRDAYAQSVAFRIVDGFLLDAPLDSAATVVLIDHVQTLTRSRSPEGAVLLRALRRLEGRWDEGRRAAAARLAADHLGAEFARRAACVGCTVEEALAGMWPEARRSNDPLLYEMAAVHRELLRIARRGTPMPA